MGIDVLKAIPSTKVAEEERAQDASMAECLAAAFASAQHGFGKFFKAQLWENVHDVINSTEGSDILVFKATFAMSVFCLLVMFAAPR